MEKTCAVILAAGDGKRMKSAKPKVCAEVLFKPMISWVIDAVSAAGVADARVVLGAGGEHVAPLLPQGFSTAFQAERKGTGHAAMMAADFLRAGGFSDALVLYGDSPFISPEDISAAYQAHKQDGRQVTVFSAQVENPAGYGRIVRERQNITAIVEQRDTDEKTAAITEINAGVYWCEVPFLLDFFENMQNHNAQDEYYLTDVVSYAVQTGKKAGAYIASPDTALGANDRESLALLNAIAREKVLQKHWQSGVNIPFTDGVVIGADVHIGADTTILPGTIIKGKTVIGEGCEIGPNSYLENAAVGDFCRVISTRIESSQLENGVKIGPMSNVRPNCHIGESAKIGDYVELKNSNIGRGTAVAHLTYVGDSDVGSNCNFGCGVVTVNYDGSAKYRTVIGDDVFIGCNTNLIAPVTLGDRVYTAAGTTVTEDVPDDALVIGRARQSVKLNWARERGLFAKK